MLFFPIINAFSDNTPPITTPPTPPTTFTAKELLDLTTPNMNPTAVTLSATLDGMAIPNLTNYRQTTDPNKPFSYTVASADNVVNGVFGFDASNGTGIYPATVFPAVQDGYYLAITGLAPGGHTLTFGGTNASGAPQDNTYNLLVTAVPEPASLILLATGLLGSFGAWWLRRGQSQAASGC